MGVSQDFGLSLVYRGLAAVYLLVTVSMGPRKPSHTTDAVAKVACSVRLSVVLFIGLMDLQRFLSFDPSTRAPYVLAVLGFRISSTE